VPVGEAAARVSKADVARVPMAGWGGLAVVLSVVFFSWIGYHRNRQDMEASRQGLGTFGFAEWRFVQFLVEIAIVGVYFAMCLRLDLPSDGHRGGFSASWPAAGLLVVYALYLVWDWLDASIAKQHSKWRRRAKAGSWVTLAFVAAFGAVLGGVELVRPRSSAAVFSVDAALVVLLYLYRVAQPWWIEGRAPATPATPATPTGSQ